MTIVGSIIVIATIILLIMKYDAKVVLLAAGLLMGIIGGQPMEIFKAFEKSMTSAGLISSICSCMGFALVMRYTSCDKHLVNFLASILKRVPFFLIPGVVIATYFINMALPSAAGTAAAAGAVFIPLMNVFWHSSCYGRCCRESWYIRFYAKSWPSSQCVRC